MPPITPTDSVQWTPQDKLPNHWISKDQWGSLPLYHPDYKLGYVIDSKLLEDTAAYKKAMDPILDFITRCNQASEGYYGNSYWFRGQTSAKWPVVPSMLRDEVRETLFSRRAVITDARFEQFSYNLFHLERKLLDKFIYWGLPMSTKEYQPIENYTLGQHHGLPTRLLDWSNDYLMALWFAVENDSPWADDSDGLLIALDPFKEPQGMSPINLNNKSFWTTSKITSFFKLLLDKDMSKTELKDAFREFSKYEAVVEFPEKLLCPRLINQSAHFTFHSPAFISDTSICTKGVHEFFKTDCYVIPREHKKYVRLFLIMSDVSRRKVYPDLDNLAQDLKDRYIVKRK